MLFNSFSFLFFFTILVVIFYLIPHKFRWILLVAASLYFYSTFNLNYVLLILSITLLVYFAGLLLGRVNKPAKKKTILIAGTILSLLPLFIFKYFDFFSSSFQQLVSSTQLGTTLQFPTLSLILPAGLSFFTFSCLSYIFDVYRGKLPTERHLGHLTLYISFFPKLLAGPIERATAFLPQILNPVRFDPAQVTPGLRQILWGLFKKVVIADRLAVFVDAAFKNPDFASPVALLIASYFFAFQIYCDFSGYSDIAIGAARVLGFNLMENFRRPYLAQSVPEFWGKDRWHISLSQWFRDYMYIPMGGSKVSRPRFYFNQMAVFLVSGLWHGANWTFIIWGGLNGIYQMLTVATDGLRKKLAEYVHVPNILGSVFSVLITFHLVLISWVFFRAASIADALTVLTRVTQSFPKLPALLSSYAYTEELVLSIVLILVLLVIEMIDEKRSIWQRLETRPVYVRWAVYYALLFCLLVIGKWNLHQFVYMQF